MYIQLPKRFDYREDPYNYAEINEGILHIYGDVSYRKLMYRITFTIKGNKRCAYCGIEVPKKSITIDHINPQDLGGPSIPDNLVPCCENCNSLKSNLNSEQFAIYQLLKKKTDKKAYRKSLLGWQESIRKSGTYGLPNGWLEKKKLDEIYIKSNCSINLFSKKSNSMRAYHIKYGCFPKPIIVDRNGFVLDGHTIFMVAKQLEHKQVSVIVLENVELHM